LALFLSPKMAIIGQGVCGICP